MRQPLKGVVTAVVTDNNDPQNEGRVQVVFPWLGDETPRWLPVASPFAGAGRGLFMMPEADDEAIVAFDHGDIDHGYIVGFLWSPENRPPDDHPDVRGITSRSGHFLRFYDADEAGGNRGVLLLVDAHGNGIAMTNGVLSLFSTGHLSIDAPVVTINGRTVRPIGGPL
jgi:uncharacterized protein involved in type VI secretion and phage assembly